MKIVWESQGLRQQPDIFFIGETSEIGPREQFTFYFSLLLFPENSVKFNMRPNGGSCRKCFLKFSFQTEPQVRQIWERHVCEGNNLYFVFYPKIISESLRLWIWEQFECKKKTCFSPTRSFGRASITPIVRFRARYRDFYAICWTNFL